MDAGVNSGGILLGSNKGGGNVIESVKGKWKGQERVGTEGSEENEGSRGGSTLGSEGVISTMQGIQKLDTCHKQGEREQDTGEQGLGGIREGLAGVQNVGDELAMQVDSLVTMHQIEPECLCAEGGGDQIPSLQDSSRNGCVLEDRGASNIVQFDCLC